MKFTQYLDKIEEKNFTIVENKENDVLLSYNVTYSFGGKTLTEDVDVSGLSKKSTKKKLEDAKKKLRSKIKFVVENVVDGKSDLIPNDLGPHLLPLGFTVDCTLLTPQEITDTAIHVSRYEPVKIAKWINQLSDAISSVEKLGQKNREEDLKVRLAIASLALKMADKKGEFKSE